MTINERIHSLLGKPMTCDGPAPLREMCEHRQCTAHELPIPAYDTDPVASHTLRAEMRERGFKYFIGMYGDWMEATFCRDVQARAWSEGDTELEAVAKAAARALEGK